MLNMVLRVIRYHTYHVFWHQKCINSSKLYPDFIEFPDFYQTASDTTRKDKDTHVKGYTIWVKNYFFVVDNLTIVYVLFLFTPMKN